MKEIINIKSFAKINLFLRVLERRNDNYHNIRSGVTIINLFDEIEIKTNDSKEISYYGNFAPKKGFYDDCIIKKTLKFLNIDKNFNFKISIKKIFLYREVWVQHHQMLQH